MSARARYKFKRKRKLVSEVRRHEYEDTTTNKGVRVKEYNGERRQVISLETAGIHSENKSDKYKKS